MWDNQKCVSSSKDTRSRYTQIHRPLTYYKDTPTPTSKFGDHRMTPTSKFAVKYEDTPTPTSKFDHHAAWRRPSLAQERAAHAVLADLYRRYLRPERGALPSIIPPEHTGIISEAVEARAGVLPSELLQLSFGALLKMATVFTNRRASEP